ncbi:hypothetical protein DEO72_LG9g1902 [Vigna unguiculata]|uniref:Uncharacterized protein n=1 Tax=Vigna unguiculata TaxID=3917 RepID=A0A4D6N0T8_VIGUN|nr:hypothetical protein DEO72_LG9g1902 [Vigna unguiculata]
MDTSLLLDYVLVMVLRPLKLLGSPIQPHSCKQYLKCCLSSFQNALLGLLTALGQANSKLNSSSLLRSALGAAGPVGLRVEARYQLLSSGETRHSRPSDPVSPRRDLQKQTLARAQAKGLRFERGVGSLRRGRGRLSECAKNLSGPLSRSRLSEGLQLERGDSPHLSEGS